MNIPSSGPFPSKLLVVGEAPSADDIWKQKPFSGRSGDELARMLHESAILQSEARLTYVIRQKAPSDFTLWLETTKSKAALKGLPHFWQGKWFSPQVQEGRDALVREIRETKPEVVLALGETALWALTGEVGITSWRGSLCDLHPDLVAACECKPTVIATHSPASIMRMWDWRAIAVRDLKRVADYLSHPELYQYPSYSFAIQPTLPGVIQTLRSLLGDCQRGKVVKLSCDIETIARNIACIGIAWSPLEALCIPLMDRGAEPYWNFDEEVAIYALLKELLTHPNCWIIGQNFNYDAQHFAKSLGYYPNLRFDTMLAQHVLFPGLPKSLDFISSMYAHYHRYWKDELDDYHKMPDDLKTFWTYNCKDAVITFECAESLESTIIASGMQEQFAFQMRMAKHVFNTMLRGVRIDQKSRGTVAGELMEAIAARDQLIHTITGEPLNTGSPKQMKEFFYDSLSIPPILHKKSKKPTLDDDALESIAHKNPILKPLISLIQEKRSLGVFLSTFCMMPLDSDGRMRTSYNVAGTETFRFNSAANAFGSGGNLQNIPKGDEK
jgi:uracil-DNA glycosylase